MFISSLPSLHRLYRVISVYILVLSEFEYVCVWMYMCKVIQFSLILFLILLDTTLIVPLEVGCLQSSWKSEKGGMGGTIMWERLVHLFWFFPELVLYVIINPLPRAHSRGPGRGLETLFQVVLCLIVPKIQLVGSSDLSLPALFLIHL